MPPSPSIARLGTTTTTTLKNANEDDEEREEMCTHYWKNAICFCLYGLHPFTSIWSLFVVFYPSSPPPSTFVGAVVLFHPRWEELYNYFQYAISKRSLILAFSTIHFITMQSVLYILHALTQRVRQLVHCFIALALVFSHHSPRNLSEREEKRTNADREIPSVYRAIYKINVKTELKLFPLYTHTYTHACTHAHSSPARTSLSILYQMPFVLLLESRDQHSLLFQPIIYFNERNKNSVLEFYSSFFLLFSSSFSTASFAQLPFFPLHRLNQRRVHFLWTHIHIYWIMHRDWNDQLQHYVVDRWAMQKLSPSRY